MWIIVAGAALLIALGAWFVGVVMGGPFGFRRALHTMRSIAQRSGPIEQEIIRQLADYMEEEERR